MYAHTPSRVVVALCSNESLAVPCTLYAPIASPLSNYPPRLGRSLSPPGDLHHLLCSIAIRELCLRHSLTSVAVDAGAATRMESARRLMSASTMNDGSVSLLLARLVVLSTRRRRVCVDVRVSLGVEIVTKWGNCIPSERVFARKRVPTLVTQEVTLFQMHLECVSNGLSKLLLKPNSHSAHVAPSPSSCQKRDCSPRTHTCVVDFYW